MKRKGSDDSGSDELSDKLPKDQESENSVLIIQENATRINSIEELINYVNILLDPVNVKISYPTELIRIAFATIQVYRDKLLQLQGVLLNNPNKIMQLNHYGLLRYDILNYFVKEINEKDNDKLLITLIELDLLLFNRIEEGVEEYVLCWNVKNDHEDIIVSQKSQKCTKVLQNIEKIYDLIDNIVAPDIKEVQDLIKQYPYCINAKDQLKQTIIHEAVFHGHKSIVALLVAMGGHVNVKDIDGFMPLHVASMTINRCNDIVRMLANDYSINAQDNEGDTPLHVAIYYGRIEMVRLLIDMGANLMIKNNEGKTPLDIAKEVGREDIIDLLNKAQEKVEKRIWVQKEENKRRKIRDNESPSMG